MIANCMNLNKTAVEHTKDLAVFGIEGLWTSLQLSLYTSANISLTVPCFPQ